MLELPPALRTHCMLWIAKQMLLSLYVVLTKGEGESVDNPRIILGGCVEPWVLQD